MSGGRRNNLGPIGKGHMLSSRIKRGIREDNALVELTKTDFVQYLNCPKSLWMLKNDPENYPYGEFSAFLQKLTREGYEVERYVRQYFANAGMRAVDFQSVFETDDGLFARADALEQTSGGETILYEVKSSTRVKTDSDHNYIKDACFQKICAERAGQKIDRVYLVHLNADYVRKGDVDPPALLVFADVTENVGQIAGDTEAEIKEALNLLREKEINKDGCSCLYNSRAHHCDTFSVFNPDIPTPSIYSIPRLSAKKRADFVANRIFDPEGVPDDYPLSKIQQIVVLAAKKAEPQINLEEIRSFLLGLSFPIHFFDFETFASAVPFLDGASPHKQFPIQYSLHILEENGSLSHQEFLEREAQLPLRLVEHMQADIGREGNIVSWHASFEKTQNRELAKLFPDKAPFLSDLNDRMVDLEDLFKSAYVDARFNGSTSIKKVLAVICPELSHKDLDIQDGSSAMEAWERMIKAGGDEADQIASALLSYCERDTFAMVEIYRFLTRLLDH